MSEETIEITKKEYAKLLERCRWLDALECAGVDNWSGCDQATDMFDEWDEEVNI